MVHMANPWIENWFEQVKKLRGGLMSADQWDKLDPKTQHLYKAKFAALGGKHCANRSGFGA
jgi:hypothetical protein